MKTTYKSVPVIATVIGSVTRKAMYITHVTSLDSEKIYKDTWMPVSWYESAQREHRYTDKRYGLHNVLLTPSTFYDFPEHGKLLITNQGPVNSDGAYVRIDGVATHTIAGTQRRVEWEFHSQSLVQFPMSKATPSMDIHPDKVISRLVDNQPKHYIELTDRYIIYLPQWFFIEKKVANKEGKTETVKPIMQLKYQKYTEQEEEIFANDNEFYGVTESQDISHLESLIEYENDRAQSTFNMHFSDETIPSLHQWELDNPEYMSYS